MQVNLASYLAAVMADVIVTAGCVIYLLLQMILVH